MGLGFSIYGLMPINFCSQAPFNYTQCKYQQLFRGFNYESYDYH
jgi:hypothetical protein